MNNEAYSQKCTYHELFKPGKRYTMLQTETFDNPFQLLVLFLPTTPTSIKGGGAVRGVWSRNMPF